MRKILVYIYDGMATFEIALLTQLLSSTEDTEIIIVADEIRQIKDKPGFSFTPQLDLKSVDINEIDGIIIPGGWLAHLDEQLISLIRALDKEQKLIAAICAAPWILAKAGVLNSRRYATSIDQWQDSHRRIFQQEDPFPREGYTECRVVRDGHIITAKGPAFIDFTMEVCDYFGLFEDETERVEFEQDFKRY